MRMIGRLGRVSVVAMALMALAAPAATAYPGQVAGQVLVTGPGVTVACNKDVILTALVLETGTNAPIEGQPVTWSFVQTQDPADSLNPTDTTTNSEGKASTTVSFGPTSGTRIIRATADDAHGDFVIKCVVGGLPPTDALPTSDQSPSIALALAGAAVLLGFGLLALQLRRR